ncbi:MAG: type II toxin-antitoxin system VapC family toxin [Acidobacteriota bacterium]|jgi:predicted nucleic acid-binding protein
MGILSASGKGPVALDTSVFIYFLEEHPDYLDVVKPLFAALDRGELAAVTSTLTLLEVSVVPLRHGDVELARRYEQLLSRGRGLSLVEVSRVIARDAAALRAAMGLRTPDAIQLATALRHRCTAFVTNDRALPSLPGLRVLQLSTFLPPSRSGRGARVSEP